MDKKISFSITTFFASNVFWCGVLLFLSLPHAFAAEIGIRVLPSVIKLQMQPPTTLSTPITIENTTQDTITLSISLQPFKASAKQDGSIVYEEVPAAESLFAYTTITQGTTPTQELTLAPHQLTQVLIGMDLPATLPERDYYFSILFVSKDTKGTEAVHVSEDGSYTTLRGGVATHVLVTLGHPTATGAITQFQAPGALEHSPVPFSLLVENTSKHAIAPSGTIFIQNMFGQTVGKVAVPSTPILAGASRYLSNQTTGIEKTPQILWQEPFIVGVYTAHLKLQLSDTGPVYERTIHFVAIPIQAVLVLVLILIVGVLIFSRVRKRLHTAV